MARIPGLSIAKAIEQHRLSEYHLSSLPTSLQIDEKYREFHNYKNRARFELDDLVSYIKSYKLTADTSLTSTPLDGILPTNTTYEGNPYEEPIPVLVDPREYGFLKESTFHADFITTKSYHDIFAKNGLMINNTRGVYHIENFGGVGITVCSKPDFEVVDTKTGELVGFIEYKARVNCPSHYNNYYSSDIMQTSLYSLIGKDTIITTCEDKSLGKVINAAKTTRCWIIQNYDSDKFAIDEVTQNAPLVISSMINQLHRIIYDVSSGNTRFESIQNVKSEEYLYTRENILGFMIQTSTEGYFYKEYGISFVPLGKQLHEKPKTDYSRITKLSATAQPFVLPVKPKKIY